MIKIQKIQHNLIQTQQINKRQQSQQSKLQMISQSQRPNILPRVNKQFIGIGHQLQRKKQQRRKIQQQQKAIIARVSFLQKQQQKTRRELLNKRKKFIKLIQTKERQQNQHQQKNQWRRSQQQQLSKLKHHNNYIRIIHRNNLNSALQSLHTRNHSDYARGKQKLKDDQALKRYKKYQDIQEKRDHMISINISKEKGKIRVDKFFKTKNKQHLNQYKSRIKNQQDKTIQKINSIKNLEARQLTLKDKLQNSTLRASRMQQLISKISKTIQPPCNSHCHSKQRHHMHIKPDTNTTTHQTYHGSLTQRNSASGKIVFRSDDSVEENIQVLNDQTLQMQKQIKVVRKRRRNKHANRYNQYEQF